jgi:hypothetical protein
MHIHLLEVVNKDGKDSYVANYPKEIFKLDGQWQYLELIYDGNNKTI